MKTKKDQALRLAANASQCMPNEYKMGLGDVMSCLGKHKHATDAQEVA
ncbi:hypothetical protein [Paraburkholderia terrae]|nr:hypothetical protein [Paraburkholderia terrae]GJG99150.1 hypothetical protein CBA19C8_01360 [Paraburkholderia terrae]